MHDATVVQLSKTPLSPKFENGFVFPHSSLKNSSKENFSELSLAISEKNFLIATDQANNHSFWPKIQFKNVLKLAVFAKLPQNNFLAEPFSGITNTRKQEGFSTNEMRLCPLDLTKYFRRYY